MVKTKKNHKKIHRDVHGIKVELNKKDKKLEKIEEKKVEEKKLEEKKENKNLKELKFEETAGALDKEESRAQKIEKIREEVAKGELEKINERENTTKDFSEKILEEHIGFAAPVIGEVEQEDNNVRESLEQVAGGVVINGGERRETPGLSYDMRVNYDSSGGNYDMSSNYQSGDVGAIESAGAVGNSRSRDRVISPFGSTSQGEDRMRQENRIGGRGRDNNQVGQQYQMNIEEKEKTKLPFEQR